LVWYRVRGRSDCWRLLSDDRYEDAALRSPLCEEAFDLIEPRTYVGVVEGEALLPILAPWHACGRRSCRGSLARLCPAFASLALADELLMPVALHDPADHRIVENVQRGKQLRRARALVVMPYRAGPPSLQRQAGRRSRAWSWLFFVSRQNDGVRRRIDRPYRAACR
jgi:hypothetical protein